MELQVESWKEDINKWLSTLNAEFINELWDIVSLLKAEQLLFNRRAFSFPLRKFKNKGFDLKNVEQYIGVLSSREILTLFVTVKDPLSKEVIDEITLPENEDIFYFDSAEIWLDERFQYLYDSLKGKIQLGINKRRDYIWKQSSGERSGSLTLPTGKEISFRGGTCAALNILFTNIEHDIRRDQLKKALAESNQKGGKNPKVVNVSRWLSDLKDSRKTFFEYFDITYDKPDNYKLTRKSPNN